MPIRNFNEYYQHNIFLLQFKKKLFLQQIIVATIRIKLKQQLCWWIYKRIK
jgi:hypothetical protein